MRSTRRIERVELAAQPPAFGPCVELLRSVNADAPFAVFGGAVRDTHYAAYWGLTPKINDYDIRVWLPEDNHEVRTQEFVRRLGEISGSDIEHRPTIGSDRIRYYLPFSGTELDVSIRSSFTPSLGSSWVALERASEADAGISSVAIDSEGVAWATEEFLTDVADRMITMYPRPNSGNRLPEYAQHMQEKFPDHQVVWY